MIHFSPSAVYITRKLGENDDVFWTRDRDFLNPQNPNFWSFWQTRSIAKKKVTADVIFSHADMLTGCTLDANNINKFRAYRRLICCFSPRMPRESWVGMSMAFSLTMEIFFYHMYQARMWSCSLDLVLLHGLQPPHQSPVAYCNTLKDLAKRRHVSHTSTGACGAFFSLRVLVFKMYACE